MTTLNQRTALESALIEGMKTINPDINIIGENADNLEPSRNIWIRMSFVIADQFYPCIGDLSTVESDGIMSLQVFSDIGVGTGESYKVIDQCRKILKNTRMDGIEVLTFDVSSGVLESDQYMIILRCFYRHRDKD